MELEQTVYALDSTTIDLCLSLFPWARFRRRKGAVKLHTLLDLRGNIPTFVRITHGKTHDVTVLDHLPIEPGSFYVHGSRVCRFSTSSSVHDVFGVLRDTGQTWPRLHPPQPVGGLTRRRDLRSDQTIVLAGPKTSRLYPDPLRRDRRSTTPRTTGGSCS